MATKLEGLEIEEVSGVDDPANQVPGWIVLKSTAGAENVLDEVQEIHENLEISLTEAEEYLPADVQESAGTVRKYLRRLLGGDEGESAEESDSVEKGKEDIEMTHDELNEILAQRDERLLEEFAVKVEELAKSLESIDEDSEVEPTEEVEYVSSEDHAATREALEKALDRIDSLEKAGATRSSILGQEDATGVEKSEKPGLSAVLQAVAQGQKVTLT